MRTLRTPGQLLNYVQLDVVLGTVCPVLIAVAVLWKVVMTPGLVFVGDFMPPTDVLQWSSQALWTSWNSHASSPGSTTFVPGLAPLLLATFLGLSSESSVKILLIMTYSISGTFIYLASRLVLPRTVIGVSTYPFSALVSVAYMLNPVTISEIHLTAIILSYAMLPLSAVLFARLVKKETLRASILCLLVVSFTTLVLQLYYPAVLFFALFMLTHIGLRFFTTKSLTLLIRDGARLLLVISLGILMNSYWLLPYLAGFAIAPISFAAPGVTAIPTVAEILNFWGSAQGWNVLNVLTVSRGFYWPHFQNPLSQLASIALVSMMGIPLVVWTARTRFYRALLNHSIVFVVLLLFAARDPPFIWLPLSIVRILISYSVPFNASFFAFTKQPNIFVPVMVYPYSFLLGAVAYTVLNLSRNGPRVKRGVTGWRSKVRFRTNLIAVVVLALILLSMVVYSHSFSQDGYGTLQPVEVPAYYSRANSFFDEQPGDYRVWWLPPDLPSFSYDWAPKTGSIGTHPLIAETRIFPQNSYFQAYIYGDALIQNETTNLGKILSIAGTKYLVMHTDISPVHSFDPSQYSFIRKTLQKQQDLFSVWSDGPMEVFENSSPVPYVFAATDLSVIVGGYGTTLALAEIEDINLLQFAPMFAGQVYGESLLSPLMKATHVIFASNQTIDDLAMDSDDRDYIFPWKYGQTSSSTWQVVSSTLELYLNWLVAKGQQNGLVFPNEGDFLIAEGGIATTGRDATLSLPIPTAGTGRQIWARILFSPLGGTLSFRVGNSETQVITRELHSYFKWVKVGDLDFATDLKIVNLDGLNVVNILATPTKVHFESNRGKLVELLLEKNVIRVERIFLDRLGLTVGESASNLSKLGPLEFVAGDKYVAQIFVPSYQSLAGVELTLARYNATSSLLLQVTPVSANGYPDLSHILAEVQIPPATLDYFNSRSYFFRVNASLSIGERYAIVLRMQGNAGDYLLGNFYYAYYLSQATYGGGGFMRSMNRGADWSNSTSNLMFKTFYHGPPTRVQDARFSTNSITYLYAMDLTEGTEAPLTLKTEEGSKLSVKYFMPYSGRYEVSLNIEAPLVLIIPETYNPYWQTNMTNVLHIPVYSLVNGFYITKTGSYSISVSYSLEDFAKIGFLMTTSSLAIGGGVLAFLVVTSVCAGALGPTREGGENPVRGKPRKLKAR